MKLYTLHIDRDTNDIVVIFDFNGLYKGLTISKEIIEQLLKQSNSHIEKAIHILAISRDARWNIIVDSVAIGHSAQATGTNGVAIGINAVATVNK
jgi:hypothetical protein